MPDAALLGGAAAHEEGRRPRRAPRPARGTRPIPKPRRSAVGHGVGDERALAGEQRDGERDRDRADDDAQISRRVPGLRAPSRASGRSWGSATRRLGVRAALPWRGVLALTCEPWSPCSPGPCWSRP